MKANTTASRKSWNRGGRVRFVNTRWGPIPAFARESWLQKEQDIVSMWHAEASTRYVDLVERQARLEVYERNMKIIRGVFNRNKMWCDPNKPLPRLRDQFLELVYYGSGVQDWSDVITHFEKCFKMDERVHPCVLGTWLPNGQWFSWQYPMRRFHKYRGWYVTWVLHPMSVPITEDHFARAVFSLNNMIPGPKHLTRLWQPELSKPEVRRDGRYAESTLGGERYEKY